KDRLAFELFDPSRDGFGLASIWFGVCLETGSLQRALPLVRPTNQVVFDDILHRPWHEPPDAIRVRLKDPSSPRICNRIKLIWSLITVFADGQIGAGEMPNIVLVWVTIDRLLDTLEAEALGIGRIRDDVFMVDRQRDSPHSRGTSALPN